jgi:ubiquinone/menaquinone biosynthesis C-methylase UbiE
VRHHRYAGYRFDNPPLLQIVADRLAAPLIGPGRYGRLLDSAGLLPGHSVLDFGCGGGIGARTIAKRIGPGGKLACVDVSAFWMNTCSQRLRGFSNVDFYRGDLRELPVPDAAFDLVFVCQVLRFIADADRRSVFDALSGKIAAGGRMLVCEKTAPRSGLSPQTIRSLAAGAGLTEAHSALDGGQITLLFSGPGDVR